MSRQKTKKTLLVSLKQNSFNVLGLAFVLCWAFCIRYSAVICIGVEETRPSYLFSFVAIGTVFIAAIACLCMRAPLPSKKAARNAFIIYGVCGSFATALPVLLSPFAVESNAVLLLAGFLVGISLFCILYASLILFRLAGLRLSLELITVSALGAVFLFLLLNQIISLDITPIIFSFLPLVGTSLLILGSKSGTRYSFFEIAQLAESVRAPQTSSAIPAFNNTKNNPTKTSNSFLARSYLLVFFASFFVVHTVCMRPITTHIPLLVAPSIPYIGSVNMFSLMMLALWIVLMVVFLYCSARIRQLNSNTLLVLAIVFFSVTFLVLPSMKETRLDFVLLGSLSACILTLTMLYFSCLIFSVANKEQSATIMRKGFLALSGGATLAAGVAALLVGPLFNKIPYQDIVFYSIPAALSLILVCLSIGLKEQFVAIFFPEIALRKSVDLRNVADRTAYITNCYKLTQRESEVLTLLSEGRNEPYIEQTLGISRATVKTHINHIYQKTNVSSRQELLDLIKGI